MQTYFRVRLQEKIHEDGILAVEVVVCAETEMDAVARAMLILLNKNIEITWVEWVEAVSETSSSDEV